MARSAEITDNQLLSISILFDNIIETLKEIETALDIDLSLEVLIEQMRDFDNLR